MHSWKFFGDRIFHPEWQTEWSLVRASAPHRYALEVALEIESSFFEGTARNRVRLRFRRPLVEFRDERCLPEFVEIRERMAIASVGISASVSSRAEPFCNPHFRYPKNTAAPKTTIMAATPSRSVSS